MSSAADLSPAHTAPRGGQPLRRLLRDPMGLLGLILVGATAISAGCLTAFLQSSQLPEDDPDFYNDTFYNEGQ